MPRHLLDEKFWTRFARTYWEQKPLVINEIKSDLLELSEAEVFKLVVAAADQSRRDKTPLGFKFFVNGIRSSDVETMHVLPKRSDKSLLAYNERIERVYQDYCLVCDELLQVNKDKQHLLHQFTRELYQHVGVPNRFVEMGLYLGNYRKTPFGVHVDRCGVFSFPVTGIKKFRTWTSEYVKKHPDLEQSFRYSKHNDKSKLLVVKPGGMAYWPSSSWHIAESNGSFSATWSLGVWVDHSTQDNIAETVMGLLSEKMSSSKIKDAANSSTVKVRKLFKSDGNVDELPEVFEEAISLLKNLSADELKISFQQAWLKRVSSRGMKTAPQNFENPHINKSLKLRHIESPILWIKSAQGFHFSFAGSDTQTSTSKELLRLIKDLNAGRVCLLKDHLKGRARADDLRAVSFLAKLGAFAP